MEGAKGEDASDFSCCCGMGSLGKGSSQLQPSYAPWANSCLLRSQLLQEMPGVDVGQFSESYCSGIFLDPIPEAIYLNF